MKFSEDVAQTVLSWISIENFDMTYFKEIINKSVTPILTHGHMDTLNGRCVSLLFLCLSKADMPNLSFAIKIRQFDTTPDLKSFLKET
jgi:hypothetical protein